jgi:class 3 adenylate cyclase
MAVEWQQAMDRLNQHWQDEGRADRLAARIGINTGVVTVGDFGSADRRKYAVLGKHVNIASRLQALAEPGTVLVSEATWLLVKDEVALEANGEAMLKGLHVPVKTYQVALP